MRAGVPIEQRAFQRRRDNTDQDVTSPLVTILSGVGHVTCSLDIEISIFPFAATRIRCGFPILKTISLWPMAIQTVLPAGGPSMAGSIAIRKPEIRRVFSGSQSINLFLFSPPSTIHPSSRMSTNFTTV
jgi:hypothetical protein